jgi:hypothetical protein
MAISLNDIDLPSGDFLSKDEKERIWKNQESFYITGGEPKVVNNAEPVKDGRENFQTIFALLVKDPETGEAQERLMGLGHTRRREALAIAAVQASDMIGPCYLDQLPPSKPGFNGAWTISGEKNPNLATKAQAKGKGADVPWDD